MNNKIGNFIRKLREEKGWSQQVLADMIPIDRSNISRWENNEVQPPYDKLIKLCEIFDIDILELASGERKTKKNKQEQNKNLIDILIKKDSKYKKVKLFCICLFIILFIVSFVFLLYYFRETYNTEKIYKIYSDDEKYKIYEGIFIITSENSYMKIGGINDEIKNVELYFKINNEKNLIYSGSSDSIISDYSGYEEYFNFKRIDEYLNNIFLKIDDEEVKINFVRKYNNDNILINKEKSITNKESNIKEESLDYIKKNFNCNELECNYEKGDYKYNYNINSKILTIINKKKNEYITYDQLNYIFNFSNDKYSYRCINSKMTCLNGNCENYKESYDEYKKIINNILN